MGVINKSARGLVPGAVASQFPWPTPPIGNLSQPEGINETPTICLMLESVQSATQQKIIDAVTPLAKMYADQEEPELIFYAARDSGGVADKIRKMCRLDDAGVVPPEPHIILMDIPDNGGYYVRQMSKDSDESCVQAMIEGWKNK